MNCPACGFSANGPTTVVCTVCGELLQAARQALPRGRRGLSMRLEGGRQQWVLVRPGAPPLLLDAGQTLSIGRAKDCGLTLPSQQVSRVHAEIGWKGKRPLIRDLGSENGTEVGGERVRARELRDWDKVKIGGWELTARRVTGDRITTTRVLEALGDPEAVPLEGSLDSGALIPLLGQLEREEASGSVHLEATADADGELILREGIPRAARAGELRGAQAAFQLLAQEEGRYRFEPGEPAAADELSTSITALLMEHADRMDGRHTLRARRVDLGDLEE